MTVEKQVIIIFAATNGYVDSYPVAALKKYEDELMAFIESRHADILSDLRDKKALDDTVKPKLKKALEDFKSLFVAEGK
jgi:F-type H+-transporting ATPase subunit alpha